MTSRLTLCPAATRTWLLLILAAIVTVLCYAQGLPGIFVHDDISNIVGNPGVHLTQLSLDAFAGIRDISGTRPLAMVSFGINHYACGLSPGCFKSVNIALHLLCGLLLFLFLRSFLRQYRNTHHRHVIAADGIALAVAALWLIHPLNLSTVLYSVQRMTILASIFVLATLLCHLQFRNSSLTRRWLWALAGVFFLAMGMLCKETAALAIVWIALIEVALSTAPARRIHIWYATGALTLAAIIALNWQTILNSYATREFNLFERLLTEARLLIFYLSELAFPLPQRMSIFLDDMMISKNIFTPWTTLPAVIAILILLAGSLWQLARSRSLLSFGILFFFVGHMLESSVFGLILGYEHRNYLPGIGILLALVVLCATHVPAHRQRQLAVGIFVLCAMLLTVRSISWSSAENMAINFALHRPHSLSANLHVASHWREAAYASSDSAQQDQLFERARYHFLAASELSGSSINPLMGLLAIPATATQRTQYWAVMQRRLSDGQPDANTINSLVQMLSCAIRQPACPFEVAQLDQALQAMLTNPRLVDRAHLQYAGGAFRVGVLRDYGSGLALSLAAATQGGEPRYRVSHLYNLVLAGQQGAAEQLFAQWQAEGKLPGNKVLESARNALAGIAPY